MITVLIDGSRLMSFDYFPPRAHEKGTGCDSITMTDSRKSQKKRGLPTSESISPGKHSSATRQAPRRWAKTHDSLLMHACLFSNINRHILLVTLVLPPSPSKDTPALAGNLPLGRRFHIVSLHPTSSP